MNRENAEAEFYLLQPDLPQNSPLVILIHGYTDNKESWLGSEYTHGENLTERLLKKNGAVVLVDLPCHGFGSDENVNLDGRIWPTTVYLIFVRKFIQGIIIILENLYVKKEIDSSKIALVGYSLGSAVSLFLINEFPEIDIAVLCVPPALIYNNTDGGPLKSAEHVTVPVRFISASEDDVINNVRADTKILFYTLRSEQKDHIWYESGHSLPVAYIDSVMEWLSGVFLSEDVIIHYHTKVLGAK
jgi:predicted esterase